MLKPGIKQRVRVARGLPTSGRPVPAEYAEAVEAWARDHGGHAKLKWMRAPMNCWAVILSYRPGDPRLKSSKDGEPVLLHDYWTAEQWAKRAPARARRHPRTNAIMAGSYAYELDELGVEGIRQRLDRGNMLSGRGQFGQQTPEQVGMAQVEKHHVRQEKRKADAMDNAGARARDKRRSLLKIPFLPVGVDIGRRKAPQNHDAA